MTARQDLGAFGERLAVHNLEAAGMRIVARNVRVPGGEIDILAADGDDLVFIEVRTRRASPGAAAESVTAAKVGRMWRCAMAYCERENVDPARARLDVVSVEIAADGRLEGIEHYRGLDVPGEG